MAGGLQVYKFGGAALHDAERLLRVVEIIQQQQRSGQPLAVVVSATGKTTVQLENIFYQHQQGEVPAVAWARLKRHHLALLTALPEDLQAAATQEVADWYHALPQLLTLDWPTDQLAAHFLAQGELISAQVLHYYLQAAGVESEVQDAREYLKTQAGRHQAAALDRDATAAALQADFLPRLQQHKIVITQGFIASNATGETTTLGFEGSDFTGAILAAHLSATALTLWKDVSGILQADPKQVATAQVLPQLSYEQAASLMGYGAKVVHPQAVAMLQQANIPLHIRSFLAPAAPGTQVTAEEGDAGDTWAVTREGLHLFILTPQFQTAMGKPLAALQQQLVQAGHAPLWLQAVEGSYLVALPALPLTSLQALMAQWKSQFTFTHVHPTALLTTQHDTQAAFAQQVLAGKKVYGRGQGEGAVLQILYGPKEEA